VYIYIYIYKRGKFTILNKQGHTNPMLSMNGWSGQDRNLPYCT